MKKLVDILKNTYKDNKGIALLFIFIILIIVLFSFKTNFITEQQTEIEGVTFENVKEDTLGGWKEEKDGIINDSLKKIFDDATKSDNENTYEPIRLMASQVVAGFNYKFLANVINNDTGIKTQYYVYIYTNLDGVSSLISLLPANN